MNQKELPKKTIMLKKTRKDDNLKPNKMILECR